MVKIKIGDKVRFNPLDGVWNPGVAPTNERVVGKVIDINEDHRWFGVKFKLGDETFRTSFNFIDLVEGFYARRVEVVHD